MKKFKGIEVWRWFSLHLSKQFGYSVSFCSFFLTWDRPFYSESIGKNVFYFSYSPYQTHDHPHHDYYYEGKRLFLQIFALTLIDVMLFKTDVKFNCEDDNY